jgi:prevent-host-death family protein
MRVGRELDYQSGSDRGSPTMGARCCRSGSWHCGARGRYGYSGHKGDIAIRSANIAELRDRLTQYLREVRAGGEIIVRDRQRPIAMIVPLNVDDDSADAAGLVAAGLMRKAQRPLPAAFWRTRRAAVTPPPA